MIRLDDSAVKEMLIAPKLNGSGSHYVSDCPSCGKRNHLYVQRQTDKTHRSLGFNLSWFFSCKRCELSGGPRKLCILHSRSDLIEFGTSVDLWEALPTLAQRNAVEVIDTPSISPPLGYCRVQYHPYLASRGFTEEHFKTYDIGVSSILSKFRNRVIFIVREGGQCKGYLARSVFSKEELDNINKLKGPDELKLLRYENSASDFGSLLFGIDEIVVGETVEVIVVEGITDKANVDSSLGLFKSNKVKCVCSFGKKLSPDQVSKLKRLGVSRITIMYDPDAVDEEKSIGCKNNYAVEQVRLSYIGDKDPGDSSGDQISAAYLGSESPFLFALNKVAVRALS